MEKKKKKKERGALLRLLGGVVCLFTDLHQKSPQWLQGHNPQAERSRQRFGHVIATFHRCYSCISGSGPLVLGYSNSRCRELAGS